MTRRCSHCSNNGHNSRTCPARAAGGVRLFGVRLTEGVGSMKKSASMGNLATAAAAASSDPLRDHAADATGYASDDPVCSSNCRTDRKRGTPWTEEEHRMFLAGLQKLGKGDWRGIARNFVVSRTPTQVASHAQKYFIRQTNASRRKRRSSLFDIIPKTVDCMPIMEEELMLHSPPSEPETTNGVPSSNLGEAEVESHGLKEEPSYREMPVAMIPAFYPTMFPVPFGFWSPTISAPAAPAKEQAERGKTHEVLKPIPVLPKDLLVNADAITGMSKLSIAEGPAARMEPSALSVKLKGERQSAFHVNPAIAGSRLSQNGNSPIHVL